MIPEMMQMAAGGAAAYWAGRTANKQGPGSSWLDHIAVGLLGLAGVMAVVAVPLSRLPVIVDVRAEVVSHEPGRVQVHMRGAKPVSREMCDYLLTDAYVIDRDDSKLAAMRTVEGSPRRGATRPAGRLDFGVWTVTYPAGFDACAVTFYAHHQCAWWLQPTVTELGPVPLPC